VYILGISGFQHDAAACLIKDGELIGAAEEERFSRVKHVGGIPHQAIKFLLLEAKINFNQLDHIGFYWDPWLWLRKRILHRTKTFFVSPFFSIADVINIAYQGALSLLELNMLNSADVKVHLINHHLAHAASAFFVSQFENAAILSIDFFGEDATTLLAVGNKNKIKKITEIKYPHSLGALYAAITQYLGFQPAEDEYKVMGLASYGKPTYYDELKAIVKSVGQGKFKLNLSYFNYHLTGSSRFQYVSKKFIEKFGPARASNDKITEFHQDIACSLQKILEEIVAEIVAYLHQVTGLENLCIAGGVGLNCAMNGRLLQESAFKNIFVQPAANDAGCAMGCCYYIYHQILDRPRKYALKDAFLGPSFTNEQVKHELVANKLTFEYHDNIEEIAANLLANGSIIGWFQGKMEWGPRALGNRSILANPIEQDMQDKVNRCIKYREGFRPFAPAVLQEKTKDFFEIEAPSPYMLFLSRVKSAAANKIPAVTHVDGTARVQTVEQSTNPRFWKLINEFQKKTSIPVLLNTSFNVKGEPIVCSPKDAIRCFFSTGLDYLIIENYLIKK